MREVAEVQVRRGFCRNSTGSSTWSWGSLCCLTTGSHELPSELTEDCDEVGARKESYELQESESDVGAVETLSSECWDDASDQVEVEEENAEVTNDKL